MRLYGFDLGPPQRLFTRDWHLQAVTPDDLSPARLRRLGNLIDRTPTLAPLKSVTIRTFGWLGMDRRRD